MYLLNFYFFKSSLEKWLKFNQFCWVILKVPILGLNIAFEEVWDYFVIYVSDHQLLQKLFAINF